MWESICFISAFIAVVLSLIFILLLLQKSIFSKSGPIFQGAILIPVALAGGLYYFTSNSMLEVSTYQYVQIYSVYMDPSKDSILKSEIRNKIEDGMFSKGDLTKLKRNHLESMNDTDAMAQLTTIMPNLALEYSSPAQQQSVNMSVSMVQLMRLLFSVSFIVGVLICMLCWSRYCKATKLKSEDPISIKNIKRWQSITSKKGLTILGLFLSVNVVGLIYVELYLNNLTDTTKALLIEYAEANKDIPLVKNTVAAVLADEKVTINEFSKIKNLEQQVLINYIKTDILSRNYSQ